MKQSKFRTAVLLVCCAPLVVIGAAASPPVAPMPSSLPLPPPLPPEPPSLPSDLPPLPPLPPKMPANTPVSCPKGMQARITYEALDAFSRPFKAAQQRISHLGSYTAPSLIKAPYPFYPEKAQKAWLSGRVEVVVGVGADGRVVDTLVACSTHAWFEASAREAAKGARFKPARFRTRPVAAMYRLPVHFVGLRGWTEVLDEHAAWKLGEKVTDPAP